MIRVELTQEEILLLLNVIYRQADNVLKEDIPAYMKLRGVHNKLHNAVILGQDPRGRHAEHARGLNELAFTQRMMIMPRR